MSAPSCVSIHPVPGLPEVQVGDDLGALLAAALAPTAAAHPPPWRAPADGDVLVVAQKVVSKAEGARVALDALTPSAFALRYAARWDKDPRLVELVLRESRRVVRMERGVMITETHHGYICANAGVDLSNVGGEAEVAVLLPEDPDRSARQLREALRTACGADVAVVVADTFGRPWRVGLTQVALGVAGLAPLVDYRDSPDVDGRTLHATVIAVADELACAADLVCGKTARVPAALIRGWPRSAPSADNDSGGALLRAPEMDLFR